MRKAKIEIDSCNDCPFVEKISRQVGVSTGNDYLLDFFCKKVEVKTLGVIFYKAIEKAVDFDEKVNIPNFCPLCAEKSL